MQLLTYVIHPVPAGVVYAAVCVSMATTEYLCLVPCASWQASTILLLLLWHAL